MKMTDSTITQRVLISSRCSQTIYTQRIHLARMAQSMGWDVSLAGDHSEGNYEQYLKLEGFSYSYVDVSQKSINPFRMIILILSYIYLISNKKPAIFHAFTIKPTIAGMIGAWVSRVPVRIVTVAGLGHIFLSSSKLVRISAFVLLRFAMLFAHRVFFYNETDRNEYLRHGIVSPDKVRIVAGSGIDSSHFAVLPFPATPSFTLVFVGRLLHEKGVPELLEAMRETRRRGTNARLMLVGDIDRHNPSSLRPEEIRAAVAEGLAEWHGHVSDVRPIVEGAHAVILPSHHEGIPLALLEGAAMGRALIATDVAGCRDVVNHGSNGLLTPVGDALALADAIEELATKPEMVRAMGAAARADVVARFDTQVVNRGVVDEYAALMVEHLKRRGTIGVSAR